MNSRTGETFAAACHASGEVFFACTSAGKIHRTALDGNASVLADKTGSALGLTFGADDGPTRIILPTPDKARVIGVALGRPRR